MSVWRSAWTPSGHSHEIPQKMFAFISWRPPCNPRTNTKRNTLCPPKLGGVCFAQSVKYANKKIVRIHRCSSILTSENNSPLGGEKQDEIARSSNRMLAQSHTQCSEKNARIHDLTMRFQSEGQDCPCGHRKPCQSGTHRARVPVTCARTGRKHR